ncbi:MAG: type II secretion system F family protein [Bryobacterales bacterium]|nr:type II secretion system F family protein [Bryobacterales bacterium]
MEILIAAGLFVFLAASITVYGYVHFARPGRVFAQLGGRSVNTGPTSTEGVRYYGVAEVLRWTGEKVPISAEEASFTRKTLMMAGFRHDHAVAMFYGLRVITAALFLFLAILSRQFWTPAGFVAVIVPAAAAFAGFFGPTVILDFLISYRQEVLRLSLPDALDLMVVCVEAGLGLDQALRLVSTELRLAHPELCTELSLVSLEMRAGTGRSTALTNLAERTGEAEIRKLIAVLVQTDRFGTSMADALRTHSDFMRMRRRQESEERANKVGVKLIFPIFFFILPTMIIVAAGPGLLQLFKTLFPLMRNAQL